MSDTISDTDFLNGLELQLDFQGSSDIGGDLYDLVENDTLLAAVVKTLGDAGYRANLVSPAQAGGISLPNLAPHDTAIVAESANVGGSVTGSDESQYFAGKIAAAYAVIEDQNLATAAPTSEHALGNLLLDDAKQDYSMQQVRADGSATWFGDGGTVEQSGAALTAASQQGTIQGAEDVYGGATFGTTLGQSDLAQVQAGTAANPLGINLAHVVAASAATDATGALLVETSIQTQNGGLDLTYNTTYAGAAETTGIQMQGSSQTFDALGSSLSVAGNSNVVVTGSGAISDTGTGNEYVLTGTDVGIEGQDQNAIVFGPSGNLNFDAGPGATIVLADGNTNVDGSDVVFGGTGQINYTGSTGVGDVIGGQTHDDTIIAATSGWYEGGSGGMNFIQGSNSGVGTVLQAGGAGDHLVGGAAGGDYLLAGAGAETLTGGNSSGTQAIFGGTGPDLVQLGTGHAIINVGTGAMDLTGSGYSTLYQSVTGGALTLDASAGTQDVYGFRVGTDHANLSGGGWSDTQQNGSTVLHNSLTGTTYDLHGVTVGLGALS